MKIKISFYDKIVQIKWIVAQVEQLCEISYVTIITRKLLGSVGNEVCVAVSVKTYST